MKRKLAIVTAITLVMCLSSGLAWAQAKPKDYPGRAIEAVVQFGAGGGSDIFVRSLMNAARTELKVPINVTNITGGAGVKASTYVLSQPADGYTIYNFAPEQLINTIFGLENYRDFAPLCQVQQDISMFYVREGSPHKTIQDVIRFAKANPGRLQFTGTTPRSPDEVLIMLFARKAGIRIRYIPFDRAPESHAAVLGGHLDILHEEPGVIMSLIEAKKLIPILVFTEKRLERFPEVPTAREIGLDITMGRWRGLAVKRGTPPEIVNYLADVLRRASQSEAYMSIARASLLDLRPGWKGPAEFGKFWDEEFNSYREIFEELGYLKK
jgi:tripartite-type tricarboxylate transporter receptor subunit TctC